MLYYLEISCYIKSWKRESFFLQKCLKDYSNSFEVLSTTFVQKKMLYCVFPDAQYNISIAYLLMFLRNPRRKDASMAWFLCTLYWFDWDCITLQGRKTSLLLCCPLTNDHGGSNVGVHLQHTAGLHGQGPKTHVHGLWRHCVVVRHNLGVGPKTNLETRGIIASYESAVLDRRAKANMQENKQTNKAHKDMSGNYLQKDCNVRIFRRHCVSQCQIFAMLDHLHYEKITFRKKFCLPRSQEQVSAFSFPFLTTIFLHSLNVWRRTMGLVRGLHLRLLNDSPTADIAKGNETNKGWKNWKIDIPTEL